MAGPEEAKTEDAAADAALKREPHDEAAEKAEAAEKDPAEKAETAAKA